MEWAHHQIITIWNKMAASCETADAALLYFERKVPHFSVSLFPKCPLNEVAAEGVGVPMTGVLRGQTSRPSLLTTLTQASTRTAAAHALFIGLLQCFVWRQESMAQKRCKTFGAVVKDYQVEEVFFFIYVKWCKRFALKSKRKDFMLLHKKRNSMYTEVSLLPGSLLNLIS